jgi:ABC-type multidrug transport system ATPase subunit
MKVCKFIAKLRLLEHGLLVAAQKLNDLKTERRKRKTASESDDDDDDDEDSQESFEDFEKRVNTFVEQNISRDSNGKRGQYKAAAVFQARKETIMEFTKTAMLKQCKNCNA